MSLRELSGIMPKPGSMWHGKLGHLSDRRQQKAPRRYFTFTVYRIDSACTGKTEECIPDIEHAAAAAAVAAAVAAAGIK